MSLRDFARLQTQIGEAGGRAVMDGRSMLIGILLVAVVVLGYLYWDRENNTIFKAPGVEIRKN
jgi:hypothetical protein